MFDVVGFFWIGDGVDMGVFVDYCVVGDVVFDQQQVVVVLVEGEGVLYGFVEQQVGLGLFVEVFVEVQVQLQL